MPKIGLFCCVEILPIVLVLIRENTLSNSLSFKARAEESSVFLSSEDSTAFLRNSIVDRNSPDDEDIK